MYGYFLRNVSDPVKHRVPGTFVQTWLCVHLSRGPDIARLSRNNARSNKRTRTGTLDVATKLLIDVLVPVVVDVTA